MLYFHFIRLASFFLFISFVLVAYRRQIGHHVLCEYLSTESFWSSKFYDDLVFTVTWSDSLGVVVLGLVAILSSGEDVECLLSLDDLFDVDDAFICRIFMFDCCIQYEQKWN